MVAHDRMVVILRLHRGFPIAIRLAPPSRMDIRLRFLMTRINL